MDAVSLIDGARRARATVGILIVAALACAGCENTPKQRSTADEQQRAEDDAFAAGADRPPTFRTMYATARMMAAQGRDAESEYVLRELVRKSPKFLPAYCDLAELYMRHRRIDDAIAVLKAGLRRAPRDAVLLNDLGMCYMAKGAYQRALKVFSEAAAIKPADARYRANTAVALGLLGRYAEAEALFEQVLPEEDVNHNLMVLHRARSAVAPDEGGDAPEPERAIGPGGNDVTVPVATAAPVPDAAPDASPAPLRKPPAPSRTAAAPSASLAAGPPPNSAAVLRSPASPPRSPAAPSPRSAAPAAVLRSPAGPLVSPVAPSPGNAAADEEAATGAEKREASHPTPTPFSSEVIARLQSRISMSDIAERLIGLYAQMQEARANTPTGEARASGEPPHVPDRRTDEGTPRAEHTAADVVRPEPGRSALPPERAAASPVRLVVARVTDEVRALLSRVGVSLASFLETSIDEVELLAMKAGPVQPGAEVE